MNVPLLASLMLVLALVTPASSLAQQKIAAGDRVRVDDGSYDAKTGQVLLTTGKVVELNSDSLILATERGQEHFSLAHINFVEKYHGVDGARLVTGIVVGSVLGAGLTAAVWSGLCSIDLNVGFGGGISDSECFRKNATAWIVGFGILGGAVGALIGSRTGWERVPLDELRVGPSPVTPDGVAVSFSLRL